MEEMRKMEWKETKSGNFSDGSLYFYLALVKKRVLSCKYSLKPLGIKVEFVSRKLLG